VAVSKCKPYPIPREQGSMTPTWDDQEYAIPASVKRLVREAVNGKVDLALQIRSRLTLHDLVLAT
jgi:hypothetical protein